MWKLGGGLATALCTFCRSNTGLIVVLLFVGLPACLSVLSRCPSVLPIPSEVVPPT